MRIEDMPPARRTVARAARTLRWLRTHGFAAVIEEQEWNPLERVPVAWAKLRWRRAHGLPPGSAVPVYLVGAQRSGTNMMVRGLGTVPEFEVRNENDRRTFDRYKLRDDHTVRALIEASRHRYVLLKPLCDSHRVDRLLDGLGTTQPGRAIWAYRGVDGRVRSALAKFGDSNLQVLREFAAGHGTARWQVQRLSEHSVELVRSFDYDRLSPASGAALFWYVRNRLYFELGLHERADVTLASYDTFVAAPEAAMRRLCEFLAFEYDPRLVAHIESRPPVWRAPLELHPRIRAACDELQERLDAAARDKGYPARL